MRPVAIIDAHVHLFPERLSRSVRGTLAQAFGWQFTHGDEPAEVASFLGRNGVERFFLLNYVHKPDISAELNRWTAAIARDLSGAIPFASVHPQDANLLRVAREAIEDLGLAGFKLHLDVLGLPPDDTSLRPIYEYAELHRKPVIIHAGTGGSIKMGEDKLNADRLGRVLREFPGLKVCVPHLGSRHTDSFFDLAEACPNLWFDTAVSLHPKGACYTKVDRDRVAGLSGRIMFGSDMPNLGHTWQEELQCVLDLGLSPEALGRVFHDNALEFLGQL